MKNVAKILALGAILWSMPALAEAPKWKISESNGTVNVLRAGVSKIAITGGQLRPGDIVSTGRKSRAVLVRGQEYVVVSPSSRIRISEPAKSGGLFQFFNEVGNVLFRIDKKATPHFGVKTPYLAAVVKGTTFSVTVTDSGTAVQVTEGAVQVSTNDGGAQQLLSPGMIGMVTQDQQFRLTISGIESRVIDSPNAPVGMRTRDSASADDAVEAVDIIASDSDAVISAPISDEPVSLSELTGGLVSDHPVERAPVQLAMLDTDVPGLLGGRNDDAATRGILNGSPDSNDGVAATGGEPPFGEEPGSGAQLDPPSVGEGNKPPATGGVSGGDAGGPATGGSGTGGTNGGSNGGGAATGAISGGENGTGTEGNRAANGNVNGGGNGNGNNGNANGANNGGGNGKGNNGNGNGNGGSNGGGNGNGNNGNANGANNGGGNGNGNNGNGNGNGGSNGGGNGNGNNGNANGANNGGNDGNRWSFPILNAIIDGVTNYLENRNQNNGGGFED